MFLLRWTKSFFSVFANLKVNLQVGRRHSKCLVCVCELPPCVQLPLSDIQDLCSTETWAQFPIPCRKIFTISKTRGRGFSFQKQTKTSPFLRFLDQSDESGHFPWQPCLFCLRLSPARLPPLRSTPPSWCKKWK